MTKVDFYVLTCAEVQPREQFACRLTEKAYQLGHQIYLHVEDQRQAQAMDDLLWTFRQGSFVPHNLISIEGAIKAPVLIGYGNKLDAKMDVLINLCLDVPQFFLQFRRIVEIVDQDKGQRHAGRKRYRHYRDQGCLLETHKITL